MDELLRILRAAADPTRLRITKMLEIKPLCVCEVMSVLGMAQSTTSKHLRILLDAKLVEAIPGGTWTVYRLARSTKADVVERLLDIIKHTKPSQGMQRDAKRAKRADRNRLCRIKTEGFFSRKKYHSISKNLFRSKTLIHSSKIKKPKI